MKYLLTICLLASAFLDINAQQQNASYFKFGTAKNPSGHTVNVDSRSFIFDGKPAISVMGEIHYSRIPQKDWRREICKMRAGGITIISSYIFWNHHEWEEGIWNWSGNRDLHRFLEICKEENMPVVLRVGPFCHGEVYQGGFPEWIVEKATKDPKNYKTRSQAPGFIAATKKLYANIYAQCHDMLWKNGGTVIGMQIENECRGPWSYYMQLKDIALQIGFDLPFYTRTGWPKLNGKEEFGKLLPLYGDYADGFWDRVLTDMPGDYKKAFVMKDTRISSVIATETFGTNQDTKMENKDLQYPYLTCELGGGMMPAYHRRINISGKEAKPLAICKLGSGSNLPGYYMYHGGTNPSRTVTTADGKCEIATMAETQASPVTNYNDMPLMSYDFQSPLGEMGQLNETAYHETRWLHQFLADWGEELSQMDYEIVNDNLARRGCFEFFNDYVRIINEKGTSYVRPINMPFCAHRITADAQPFCKIGSAIYFLPINGKKPMINIDGKKYAIKADKPLKVKDITVCLLSEDKARTAFVIDGEIHFAQRGGVLYKDNTGKIIEESWQTTEEYGVEIGMDAERNAAIGVREVKMGAQKVAAMPTNEDFENAAVYSICVKNGDGSLLLTYNKEALDAASYDDYFLRINYEGDAARVYADGKLIEDNFWNGKPMLVRLSDLVNKKVDLRILPLGKEYPIYLQKEQRELLDKAQHGKLLRLIGIEIVKRITCVHN